MISRLTSHSTCLLLAITLLIGLLPLGQASGQSLDGIGKRLREAVAAGEITGEQARAMMTVLRQGDSKDKIGVDAKDNAMAQRKIDMESRLQQLATGLKEQVAAGEMTEEQAKARFQRAEKGMWERMKKAESGQSKETKVSAKPSNESLDAIKAGIEQRLRKLGESLRASVADGTLSEADAKQQYETASRSMWERYREAEAKQTQDAHDSTGMNRQIAQALVDSGLADNIKRSATGDAIVAMQRIVHEINIEGDQFKLSPRMHAYLHETVQLGDGQIKRFVRLAHRIAADHQQTDVHQDQASKAADGMNRRITKALADAGIKRKVIGDVMAAMDRIVHEIKTEGDQFELSPRMQTYLHGTLELSDAQIQRVVRLAHRMTSSGR
ncbi:MAG: hypothetical protein MK077_03100 [Phycisphaerales bacterium]|nr:hypothetical protein [Phycisphaerales bacterium]